MPSLKISYLCIKSIVEKKLILVSSLNASPQILQMSPHVFLPMQ